MACVSKRMSPTRTEMGCAKYAKFSGLCQVCEWTTGDSGCQMFFSEAQQDEFGKALFCKVKCLSVCQFLDVSSCKSFLPAKHVAM